MLAALPAALALLAWVWLALARGMFWRTDVRLPRVGDPAAWRSAPTPDPGGFSVPAPDLGQSSVPAAGPGGWPSVAVVVPARDEAAVLPQSLPALLAQEYPGRLRLIVVDDGSTDGTGEVAAQWPQITVVRPGEPPAGWAGKLWALRAGVRAASSPGESARGPGAPVRDFGEPSRSPREPSATARDSGGRTAAGSSGDSGDPGDAGAPGYLLFTDADIVHPYDSLSALVRAAGEHQLDLVSQMARLRVRTGWERLVVPAFVYFFALLYPFRWSNRPGARTAAAAGGCVLVRREALERAGGIDAVRGAIIDDVALARAVKRAGGRTFLGLAERIESVRPYPDLASLWRMVSRSAYAQLRHSLLLLAGTVLGLAVVFLAPPLSTVVGAATGDLPVLVTGLAGWLLMAATFVPILRYYRQPVVGALALPFTATLYLAMTVDSALRHYRGRGGAWKGRIYP